MEKRVPSSISTSSAPGARDVFDHPRLGVLEALDLEERRRAPDLVAGAGLAEHQALAAEGFDACELVFADARVDLPATYAVRQLTTRELASSAGRYERAT
jgi:hypothetical protein